MGAPGVGGWCLVGGWESHGLVMGYWDSCCTPNKHHGFAIFAQPLLVRGGPVPTGAML